MVIAIAVLIEFWWLRLMVVVRMLPYVEQAKRDKHVETYECHSFNFLTLECLVL